MRPYSTLSAPEEPPGLEFDGGRLRPKTRSPFPIADEPARNVVTQRSRFKNGTSVPLAPDQVFRRKTDGCGRRTVERLNRGTEHSPGMLHSSQHADEHGVQMRRGGIGPLSFHPRLEPFRT